MAGSISANLIAARQHTPQDIVMPQIMMDQAGRGMQAGQNKNDRRDRAVQFLNIVAQRFVARIKSRYSEQAKKTVAAHPDEEEANRHHRSKGRKVCNAPP